jgi:hypothetical protein
MTLTYRPAECQVANKNDPLRDREGSDTGWPLNGPYPHKRRDRSRPSVDVWEQLRGGRTVQEAGKRRIGGRVSGGRRVHQRREGCPLPAKASANRSDLRHKFVRRGHPRAFASIERPASSSPMVINPASGSRRPLQRSTKAASASNPTGAAKTVRGKTARATEKKG